MPNTQALSIAVVAFAKVGRDAVSTLRRELAALKDDKGRYPLDPLGFRGSTYRMKPSEVALDKAAKAIFAGEEAYSEAVLRAITSHGGTPEEVVAAFDGGNALLVMAATAVFGLSAGIYVSHGPGHKLLQLGSDAERKSRKHDERSPHGPADGPAPELACGGAHGAQRHGLGRVANGSEHVADGTAPRPDGLIGL